MITRLWTNAPGADRNEAPTRKQNAEAALARFGYLVKWKTGAGMAGIALTMLYFALYANAQHG